MSSGHPLEQLEQQLERAIENVRQVNFLIPSGSSQKLEKCWEFWESVIQGKLFLQGLVYSEFFDTRVLFVIKWK